MLQVANTKAWFGICMLRYRHYSLRWIHTGTDFLVTMAKPILFAKYWQWPSKQSPNPEYYLFFLVIPSCKQCSMDLRIWIVAVILWFIIRNIHLVLIPVSGTKSPKPLGATSKDGGWLPRQPNVWLKSWNFPCYLWPPRRDRGWRWSLITSGVTCWGLRAAWCCVETPPSKHTQAHIGIWSRDKKTVPKRDILGRNFA